MNCLLGTVLRNCVVLLLHASLVEIVRNVNPYLGKGNISPWLEVMVTFLKSTCNGRNITSNSLSLLKGQRNLLEKETHDTEQNNYCRILEG